MLCYGRSAGLRLAAGTTLAVEGSNTATNDHEMATGAGLGPLSRDFFVFVSPNWGPRPRRHT